MRSQKTRYQESKMSRIYSEFGKVTKEINNIDREIGTMGTDVTCQEILQEQHEITMRLIKFIKAQKADEPATNVTLTLESKIAEYNNKIEVLQSKIPRLEALKLKRSVHTYKLLRYFKIRMVHALELAIRAIMGNFKPLVAFFENECKR